MSYLIVHLVVTLVINLAVFVVLGIAFIRNYNALTGFEEVLKESWGQIETHLQRRYDALLGMSQVVQGFSSHEQAIDAVVAKARTLMAVSGLNARVAGTTDAERSVGDFLGFAVQAASEFPELRANEHFRRLLDVVQTTSYEISERREEYNRDVGAYNSFLKRFPTRLYAAYLGFKEAEYFTFARASRDELPGMDFRHDAVADGAIAGSHRFPPTGIRGEIPSPNRERLATGPSVPGDQQTDLLEDGSASGSTRGADGK